MTEQLQNDQLDSVWFGARFLWAVPLGLVLVVGAGIMADLHWTDVRDGFGRALHWFRPGVHGQTQEAVELLWPVLIAAVVARTTCCAQAYHLVSKTLSDSVFHRLRKFCHTRIAFLMCTPCLVLVGVSAYVAIFASHSADSRLAITFLRIDLSLYLVVLAAIGNATCSEINRNQPFLIAALPAPSDTWSFTAKWRLFLSIGLNSVVISMLLGLAALWVPNGGSPLWLSNVLLVALFPYGVASVMLFAIKLVFGIGATPIPLKTRTVQGNADDFDPYTKSK